MPPSQVASVQQTHVIRTRTERSPGRSALSALLAALFFAGSADGLGMLLHLIGVMPVLPFTP